MSVTQNAHDNTVAASSLTGTIASARLPNPTASTIGGVQSFAQVGHQWMNSISTVGIVSASQPAFTDISGTASNAQLANSSITVSNGQNITGGGSISLGGTATINAVLPNYITGLTLANNGTASQSISIAAGTASDSTNANSMALASTFYKTLASSWASGAGTSGSPKGGLGTGSVAASTWYHVFLIYNAGTIDVYFDTSLTAASIPTGYSAYRRIGSILTNASKNVIAFSQAPGGWFTWTTPVDDVAAVTLPATTFTNYTMTQGCPPGVQTLVNLNGIYYGAASATVDVWVGSTTLTTVAAYTSVQQIANVLMGFNLLTLTNTSQQVAAYASAAANPFYLGVQAYQDFRGQL